ncbi:MAG: CHAT domain-containing protein [Theionarchaea archaeon]|nr:MAG: hypothetical protein AYK18_05335 [Theionarchaea archaeon DG-70]MBU7011878.1 CHAT domain-containing protein [Theionarchaea archaeon]
MNEEEWIFTSLVIGGGLLAAAVVINDVFSLQKFWARRIRSRKPPPPEKIAKAHTRHQRFFHHTNQRLFSTTYVSFYLFALSLWGILIINAFILIQDILQGADYNADGRLLRLFYILVFFLLSRWYYRQEHHYTTAHKLVGILSGVIMIDLVHVLTGVDYIQVTTVLLILWIWMIGILRAVLSYEVNYARDVAFSAGIPFAVFYFLVRTDGIILFLILGPVVVLALREFITKSEKYSKIEQLFGPLPFHPVQYDSFLKDVLYSLFPGHSFAGCSVWEILFWGSMTPVVLVPVTLYLQSREEQLHKWQNDLIQWSQDEYIINPETAADRLGIPLEDTYPLLNEVTAQGKLTLYEGPQGLVYGLPPSEEMDAFIEKVNLRKTELPQRDRDLLEYVIRKGRITPPTTALLSIMKRDHEIEVSVEPAGGTISALKFSSTMNTSDSLERISHSINTLVGETVETLGFFGHFRIKNYDAFLSLLQEKGKELFHCAIPSHMVQELDTPHVVLETNMDTIPFELMWSDTVFAVKYAMGRRLRVAGPGRIKLEDTESLRALIIADPTGTLKGAFRECEHLAAELDRLVDTHYISKAATCNQVLDCLRTGYTIIHYAGHVESGLPLSDGVLDADTIQRNVKGRPVVFINGCKSAGMAHTHTALAEAFLRGGAVGYIGSLWDVHDMAAALLATDFYTTCLQKYTVGEALRKAKENAFLKSSIAWLCFVLFGDPTLRLI